MGSGNGNPYTIPPDRRPITAPYDFMAPNNVRRGSAVSPMTTTVGAALGNINSTTGNVGAGGTYNYNPTGRNNSGISTESSSVRGSFAAPTPDCGPMPFNQAFSSAPSLAQSYTLPSTTTPGASTNFDANEFVTGPIDTADFSSLFGVNTGYNMNDDLSWDELRSKKNSSYVRGRRFRWR